MRKTPAQKFEDLFVWQKARQITKDIYFSSKSWGDHSLKDQIRRAAVSTVSNIAEGFERGTKQEFLYFLYIARGSAGEVRAQLYVAYDQGYMTKKEFEILIDKADHASRLLAKFIDGYKSKGHFGQKYQTPRDRKLEEFENEIRSFIPEKYRF